MSFSDVVFSTLLLAVVVAQGLLTRRVWRSPSFERSQKVLQSKLIWLVPILGAVLVFSLMPEEELPRKSRTHEKP